jgi:signal recognition particle subunit SRP54
MSSIPGMSGMMEGVSEEDAGSKFKRMIFIMDSMSADELDSDGLIFVSASKYVCSLSLESSS